MARDLKVSMSIEAKDNAAQKISRSLKETTGQAEKASKAIKQQGSEQQKAALAANAALKQQTNEQARVAQQNSARSRSQLDEARRMAKARESLGIQSEQSIQREIAQTIASYNRLNRASVMSAREQSRAYSQMRQKVAELRQEMNGVSKLQRAEGLMTKSAAVAGGIAAAGAAFVNPIRNRMNYDERLTEMANTAFSDEDAQGR
ncbi:MAG: hypothetical protein ACRC9O_09660 [Plesiomonas sp.]|uniref:hypothetical protein n=1 Tax=Plesiomonas sp. TaxID=2486279 RepID=UPI003F33A3E5